MDEFDDIDFTSVAFDELAKVLVPFYLALKNHGLESNEAAMLTAHYWIANATNAPRTQGPQDGS